MPTLSERIASVVRTRQTSVYGTFVAGQHGVDEIIVDGVRVKVSRDIVGWFVSLPDHNDIHAGAPDIETAVAMVIGAIQPKEAAN